MGSVCLNGVHAALRLLGVLVIPAISGFGQGSLTFNNPSGYSQAPDSFNQTQHSDSELRSADDFVVPVDATLRMVTWWGADYKLGAIDQFSVRMYSDNGGMPDTVLRDFQPTLTGKYLEGSNFLPQGAFNAYRYVSLVPEPLSVVGGSRYWLSITGPSPENFRIQWEWIGTGRSMDPTDRFSLDDGKTWQMAGFDVAFQISELPEPGGWLLLAVGVAAVAWWRQGRPSTWS